MACVIGNCVGESLFLFFAGIENSFVNDRGVIDSLLALLHRGAWVRLLLPPAIKHNPFLDKSTEIHARRCCCCRCYCFRERS